MAGGRCRSVGVADCASLQRPNERQLHSGVRHYQVSRSLPIRNGASQQVNFECGYIVRDSPV